MNRRQLITGLVSLVAAPAIVRAESLMPISGEVYRIWEYTCPILPDPRWFNEPRRQDLIDGCWAPNGGVYKGVWTFFGKGRSIYSDEQIGFRKVEYPVALAA